MSKNANYRVEKNGGVYSWRYDVDLFRDFSILWLLCKVFFFTIIGIGFLFFIILGFTEGSFTESAAFGLRMTGILMSIFAVLTVLGYCLYAAIMGGNYCVQFTMDDEKVVHAQIPAQADKAKKIAVATAVVGLLAKRPSTVGAGLNATRTEMATYFRDIKKVRIKRDKETIILTEFGQNRVYVCDEDFDLVAGFIKDHVPAETEWIE